MSETLVALAGTPEGARLAMLFALVSALAHASFGALQKGRHDPWLTRGAIDLWTALLALPAALFLVPRPEGRAWWLLAGALLIHLAYKLLMAMAYSRGAYTLVYPVTRGAGALAAVALASLAFGEDYAAAQWAGVACLSGGILALALVNLRGIAIGRPGLRAATGLALAGGVSVAAYTVWDAWGIRETPDPFTFLAWFFLVTSLDFPWIALARWRAMAARPAPGPLLLRGLAGALVAFVSFGGVMLATRLDRVGEAAVLRETSTVFAALIGWLVLREPVGPVRAGLMALIALGAVLVELGGAR